MKKKLVGYRKGKNSFTFRVLPTIEISNALLCLTELTEIEFGFLCFYIRLTFAEGGENG